MPKVKTNRAIKKRFSVTKNGHIKFQKLGARHLKSNKTGAQVRQKRLKDVIPSTSIKAKKIKLALGQ